MRPLEFTVLGPPLSHQTRDRKKLKAWKATVKAAAKARWRHRKRASAKVRIVVTYFHDGEVVALDTDNICKPIQDALNGLVYNDDNLVHDATLAKRDLDKAFHVRRMSYVLARAFARGEEFIYVKVENAADARILVR